MEPSRTGTTTTCTWSACSSPGDPLRSPGPRGEQQRDTSFLIWLNTGGTEPSRSRCPTNEWVQHGEVVLSTDDRPPRRARPSRAGDVLTLGARTVLVLRQT